MIAPDVSGMQRSIRAWGDERRSTAIRVLRQGAYAGFQTTQRTLEEAVTKTGLGRASHGGEPGRIRSGQLVSDLGFYAPGDDHAWFGWPIDQESYDYAAAQDMGSYGGEFVDEERGYRGGRVAQPRIPPAGALWEGALKARETIRELLATAGFKRGSMR